jgi:hypothetical protein
LSIALGIIAGLVWLVAAYAFVRVVLAYFSLLGQAPQGQRLAIFMELGFWNFSAVEARIGPAAAPQLKTYRDGILLFFACIAVFIVLALIGAMGGVTA